MPGENPHPPEVFAPYRLTAATFIRPRLDSFRPAFRVPGDTLEDLRAIERLDQELRHAPASPDIARRLLFEALTKNAHGTASIEGNPLTEDEVESLLTRATPALAEGADEREILNYSTFMDRLARWGVPRTCEDVLTLHAHLFKDVMTDAGAFKDHVNFVRSGQDVLYVPTDPERVRVELSNALEWLHTARDVHPLVRVIVFFHEFQGIHPFRDGNGRVGRALTTLFLHELGYEGIRYCVVDGQFNADRAPYYATLLEVERNGYDFTPWVRYMARILFTGYRRARERFLILSGIPPGSSELDVGVAEWFHRLDARVVKFGDVHAAFPAASERTLRRTLTRLSDARVLERRGERKGTTYRLALKEPDA